MEELLDNSEFKRKFEYIRIRLYLMATIPCFDKIVKERVHLYSETSFIKAICQLLSINKRKFSEYYKIAKTTLSAIEDEENRELYLSLAKEYSEEFEIDFSVLPCNLPLLTEMLEDFRN